MTSGPTEHVDPYIDYAHSVIHARRLRQAAGPPDPALETVLSDLADGVHAIAHLMIAQLRQRDEWAQEALDILRTARESSDG